jgi:hypothetical protein
MLSIPDCEAVRFSGPAVLITVDDGNNEHMTSHMRLLSCLRYASVPVANNDGLVTNSFDFALILLAVIIFVDAGIAISNGVYSSFSLLFLIVVSIDENICDTNIPYPPCLRTYEEQRENLCERALAVGNLDH